VQLLLVLVQLRLADLERRRAIRDVDLVLRGVRLERGDLVTVSVAIAVFSATVRAFAPQAARAASMRSALTPSPASA
jgi:hypothetical protein